MPRIIAFDEHDALRLQGWAQAQDRLVQLDVVRRQASGTRAELLGVGALSSDVELRTIGLARGAERSLAALSPQTRAGLQAYVDGVNAWVQRNPLPIQYAALELSQFRPWTPLDCALIGKALAFQLSFDIDDGATRDFQTYIVRLGPQLGQAMFFGDTFRAAPFDKASSIPDATGAAPFIGGLSKASATAATKSTSAATGTAVSAAVLTISPRNNGPVVADLGGGQVVSVQYTGFGGTRELETFRLLNHARNLTEFTTALRYFDGGVLSSPFYANLLGRWLTNDTYPMRQNMGEVMQNLHGQQMFKPASAGNSGKVTKAGANKTKVVEGRGQ